MLINSNMIYTAVTPLINKREIDSCENQPFITRWPTSLERKQKDTNRKITKRSKRVRTAFLTDQLRALENSYSRNKYIDSQKRHELAKILNIGEKSIKIWFQNRRMKEKRQSSESSCDSSSETGNDTASEHSSSSQHQSFPNDDKIPSSSLHQSFPNEDKIPQYNPYNGHYETPLPYNNVYSMYHQQQNIHPFCTDNNMYPTQYYPSYSYEGNSYYEQGNELNNYWALNHQNAYYIPVGI